MYNKMIAATIITVFANSAFAGDDERYMHKCKYSKSSPTVIAKKSPRLSDLSIEFRRYYRGIRPRFTYVENNGKSYYIGKGMFKNKLVRCSFTGSDGKVSR